MPELGAILAASVVSIGAAVASWLLARRLGLSTVQQQVQEENDRLVATLRDRLELAEAEIKRQQQEIERLERENDELRRRVDRLAKAIADKVV